MKRRNENMQASKTKRGITGILKNYVGRKVIIQLRSGRTVEGVLERVSVYELTLRCGKSQVIVVKHAAELVEVAGD